MIQALTVVHMLVSILLVVVILLQFGRGAEAGFFSDTSSQGVFTGPGPANIMTRITTFLAVLFLGLALALAHLRGRNQGQSVFDSEIPQAMEADEATTTPAAPPSTEAEPSTTPPPTEEQQPTTTPNEATKGQANP